MDKRFYTPQEVSVILKVSPTTVMDQIHKGVLPAVRVSERIYRIPAPALERFVSGSSIPEFSVEFRRVKGVKKLGEPVGDPVATLVEA